MDDARVLDVMTVFWNRGEGRLRVGWRLAVHAALMVVSSLIFAALHGFTDNVSLASFLGVFVNALFFAAALRSTGRLSTAIGAHIAWNFVQGAVLGFPVSGDKEGASLIGIVQRGPDWITGGAYGSEAGLLGVMASLAGILLLAIGAARRFPDERSARFVVVIDRKKSRDGAPPPLS